MKKLVLIIAIVPFLAFAQLNVDNQWKNSINPIFNDLEKNRISSGILLDYAMEFTDVSTYNGVLNEDNYVNLNVYGNIYKTLFIGKVMGDTIHTPLIQKYGYNWARERYRSNQDSAKVYNLAGLFYKYQRLDTLAHDQNRIIVNGDAYYDKYINGVWQNLI